VKLSTLFLTLFVGIFTFMGATHATAAPDPQTVQLINAHRAELLADPNSPVAGNPKGDVSFVEFFDYQCSHCKKMTPTILRLLKTDPQLRVIFKESPIFGARSEFASRAALAAQKQTNYLTLHRALMKAPTPFSDDEVLAIAKSVGLNADKLQATMGQMSIDQELQDNAELARALDLPGTPAYIILKTSAASNKVFLIPGDSDFADLVRFIKAVRQG